MSNDRPTAVNTNAASESTESRTSAAALQRVLGEDAVRRNAPLAPFTTFRVGGTADWLCEPRDEAELLKALAAARAADLPVTLLGGGSNVLIGDGGIRGLVIRPRLSTIEESAGDVRAGAGVTINGLVRWTIHHGLAGLEIWAGTPGTVGGAIYGNAHFQGRLMSEVVTRVAVVSPHGLHRLDLSAADMEFGYDRSRLQRTGEVVIWAQFRGGAGEPARLRERARESLRYRKQTQPLDTPSAGCVFQNPDPARDALPVDVPPSAGALIDRAGLKGATIGGARVSSVHGNFIVNEGHATARDIRALIDKCKDEVATRFGVTLLEEIVYLGDFGEP